MSHGLFDLHGKKAVVTGGSKGLGAAIAMMLAEAGADVTAVARSAASLDVLTARPIEGAGSITGWAADVLDPGFASMLEAMDVDILVNNAGTNTPLPMADVPVDVLDQMLNLNVRSAYLAAQAAVRSMLRGGNGGAIVNITSQMGHVGSPRRTVYCMTKHALEGLTKAMAVELAPHNIRVNSVAPTFIETPMTQPMLANPDFKALPRLPRRQYGDRDELAGRWGVDRAIRGNGSNCIRSQNECIVIARSVSDAAIQGMTLTIAPLF
jgi:NAD(P)-dependent dehydrogenase (short-subunit alcohol dehydrogenase family)